MLPLHLQRQHDELLKWRKLDSEQAPTGARRRGASPPRSQLWGVQPDGMLVRFFDRHVLKTTRLPRPSQKVADHALGFSRRCQNACKCMVPYLYQSVRALIAK